MYDFEKPKHTQTRRSATTRYRPWRSKCATVKRKLLGKWPRGLQHLRESLLYCACVRAGAKLQPNLETKSGEEIPCPEFSLRSGRNTPCRWFSDLGNCQNQHSSPHAVHTDLILGEPCIDQDLWPTSGYHKQWPQAEIGTKHAFSWVCRSWKLSQPTFVSTCSVHRSHVRRIL